jgi:hypothetical protein
MTPPMRPAGAVAAVVDAARARRSLGRVQSRLDAERAPPPRPSRRRAIALLTVITALAAFLRLWQLNRLGLNSDEAVYAGQAAAIAGDEQLRPFFSVFRAHPLLFHSILSLAYAIQVSDILGRVVAAAFGIACIPLVYATGVRLYGRQTALLAAAFLAVMPYHVVVSRQILLDGPMTFFATLTLYLLVRFALSSNPAWLYASAAALGLAFLTKETTVTLLGAGYAFLALSPSIRLRIRDAAISLAIAVGVMSAYPLAVALSPHAQTAQQFLVWQLFRRSNHDLAFYPTTLVHAVGPLLLVTVAAGVWTLRRTAGWRELLLVAWIVVPAAFFELWPVKGFPYLLPITPALVLLAARALTPARPGLRGIGAWTLAAGCAAVFVLGGLLVSSWDRIDAAPASSFLAGSGGVPGGREAGRWIAANVPQGAQMLAIGPSMANILEFYGHRRVYGLSVSPNPLHRNPAYVPVDNPDALIRDSEIQYVVWDAYSASRSSHFADRLLAYRDRYHGTLVHLESIVLPARGGGRVRSPVIAIWEVHA